MFARVTSAVLLWSLMFGVSSAVAQQPQGWGTQVDGLAVFQGEADLSEGGSFSANRAFLRAGSVYRYGNGDSVGLALGVGRFDYDFDAGSTQPWNDINDIRVSVPISFGVGDRARALVIPSIRWDYETGASASDGSTYGFFTGVAWQINDRLTIGPAFGAYSELGTSELDFFPALLVDWDINDRLNLSTGAGVGATSGPGLSLNYAFSDAFSFGLAARFESIRFRLDDDGLAPGGVGEDSSFPVVATFSYDPNPGMSLSAFVGAEFDGTLRLENSGGDLVSEQDYDTAPIAGVAFQLRF